MRALPARRAAVAMARAVLVPLWLCWAAGWAALPNVVLLLMDDVSAGWDTWGGSWAWGTFHMSHHQSGGWCHPAGAYWAGRCVGRSGCGAASGTEGTGSSREMELVLREALREGCGVSRALLGRL